MTLLILMMRGVLTMMMMMMMKMTKMVMMMMMKMRKTVIIPDICHVENYLHMVNVEKNLSNGGVFHMNHVDTDQFT